MDGFIIDSRRSRFERIKEMKEATVVNYRRISNRRGTVWLKGLDEFIQNLAKVLTRRRNSGRCDGMCNRWRKLEKFELLVEECEILQLLNEEWTTDSDLRNVAYWSYTESGRGMPAQFDLMAVPAFSSPSRWSHETPRNAWLFQIGDFSELRWSCRECIDLLLRDFWNLHSEWPN